MPHFTLPLGPEGPMVNAALGVSEARRQALTAAGQTVPQFVSIRALLDTGASMTCVDPTVITALIFATVAVVESDLLSAQGFHALIGRNILSQCLFHYNGTMGLFTLAY